MFSMNVIMFKQNMKQWEFETLGRTDTHARTHARTHAQLSVSLNTIIILIMMTCF